MWHKLELLGASILAVFAPVKTVALVSMVLIMADFMTGLLVAKKKRRKITSAGFRRTLTKAFVYEIAILMGFLSERYLLGGDIPVVKLISSFIGLVELKSILENLDILHGQKIFKTLVKNLGSKNK